MDSFRCLVEWSVLGIGGRDVRWGVSYFRWRKGNRRYGMDGWMDGFLEVVIPTHSDLRRRRQHTHRYYYIHFATHHTNTDTQFIVSCRIA